MNSPKELQSCQNSEEWHLNDDSKDELSIQIHKGGGYIRFSRIW